MRGDTVATQHAFTNTITKPIKAHTNQQHETKIRVKQVALIG